MILNYFGLREEPFGVTPDPRFLCDTLSHKEALASLAYGILTGRGFMSLIAEPGMGKTTLLLRLIEQFRHKARIAFLFQTQCDRRELLYSLLTDLEIKVIDKDDVARMHHQLNDVLVQEAGQGRQCIVVIDEAQNLDFSMLETIRLLSDFETTRSKLLQLIIAGQPLLAEKIADPTQKQLRQRLSIVSWLAPLETEEVTRYIAHRLRVAGYRGGRLFDADAESLIAEHSEGIPRNINNLCFNALSLCCATRRGQVNGRMIEGVITDLEMRKPYSTPGETLAHNRSRHSPPTILQVGFAVISLRRLLSRRSPVTRPLIHTNRPGTSMRKARPYPMLPRRGDTEAAVPLRCNLHSRTSRRPGSMRHHRRCPLTRKQGRLQQVRRPPRQG